MTLNYLEDLPAELSLQILSHLSLSDISAVGLCSKSCQELAADPTLWHELFKRDFGGQQCPSVPRGWKNMYQATHESLSLLTPKGRLRYSCKAGYARYIERLGAGAVIEKGSAESGSVSSTPLHIAAQYGQLEVAQVLVGMGADVNAKKRSGCTPLYNAVEKGNLQVAKYLIKAGARPTNDALPSSSLIVAVEGGHTELVEVLLQAGADVNSQTGGGSTPLFVASMRGFEEIVDLLLRQPRLDVDTPRTKSGTTPLSIAVATERPSIVEKLLKCGACVRNDPNPLQLASCQGSTEIVRLLLRAGADVNASTSKGNFPLHAAASGGHLSVLNQLLAQPDIDLNKERERRGTALCAACSNGHRCTVAALLAAGANVNACRNGATPLFMASQEGFSSIVSLLLQYHPALDLFTFRGASPLIVASERGHASIVEMLLKAGAEVDSRVVSGASSLYVASQNGHVEVVKVLLKYGADMNLTRHGKSAALDIARQKSRKQVARLLEQAQAQCCS